MTYQEAVAEAIAAAPPLTDERRARLRALLAPAAVAPDQRTNAPVVATATESRTAS